MEDSLEGDLRSLRERADAVARPVELTEDDLVLPQQDRPEIPDVLRRRQGDSPVNPRVAFSFGRDG